MKLANWLILLAAIIALLVGIWVFRPTLIWDTLVQVDQQFRSEPTLYQWTEPSGRVQIADQPPPGDTPYKVLNYRHDVNVVPETEPR